MIHRFIARNIQSFSFILALAVVGCIAPAVAQTTVTVYVDADFAGANLGDTVEFTMPGGGTVEAEFGVDAFAELQNGVDAVDENGTVLLGSDIVEGLVAVDKALTLDGNGFTLSSTSPNFGVSIQSTDATIENLVVDDAGTFGIHQSPGSDNLVIRGTTVQNGGGSGFAMNCSENILLENISAFDNGGNGVSITNCTDVVIDGITTAGNQFTTFSAGIGIFSSEDTCLPEGTDGVQITDSANISEPVPVYTQVSSGSGTIANVDVPLNLGPALLGFGAQAELYYHTVEAALNAADQAITDDPAAKPITYVRDRSADQLIVADFMSINAATTNAQVADSVSVAPGVYDESVLVAVDGISVLGPNADVAPWDTGRGTEARIQGFVRVTAPDTTVDGLEISPPDATTNDEGEAVRISNSPDGVSILNNIVRDFDENGVPEWEGIDGINVFGGDGADPVDSITVSNNLIDSISGRPTKGGAAGISIQGHVTNGLISGNRVRNVGMLDTPFSFGIVIRGTGNHAQTPFGVAVTGNQVESILSDATSEFRGVAFAVEAGSADITGNAASGNEWQFEDKTDTSGLLEQVLADNDFDRAAVVRENPIVVPVIFSSIQEAIDAAADDQIIEVSAGTYPESIQIATQGLTVRGANTGIPVSDRTAGDAAETVIDAQSGTHAVDIRATGVTLDGFSVTTSSGILRGIGETTSVTGTRIVNNFVYGFPDSIGINLAAGSSGAQLQGNAVSNVYAGIYLSANASAATVSGNFITGLAGGSGPDQGAAVVFEGNNTDVAVNGNELTGNAIGVFLFDLGPDLSGTEVSQNVIVGNASGITNTNTSKLQATCNWWGAADGPGGEGPGTGDSVSANVDFAPWLDGEDGQCIGGFSLEISPDPILFGDVSVGGSGTVTLTLSNAGLVDIDVTSIGDVDLPFARTGAGTCSATPFTLGVGLQCTVEYSFSPTMAGTAADALVIQSGSPSSPDAISLSGTGVSDVNLALTGAADTDPVVAGTPLTWTLSVENRASIQANGVELTPMLPVGTTLVSTNGCAEDPAGFPVCTIGSVAGGGTAQVSLTADTASSLSPDELLTFDAIVASDEPDAVPELNSVSIDVGVERISDLSLTIEPVTEFIPSTENEVQFLVAVTNSGPSDVIEAVVASELGGGLVDIDWTCEAGPGGICVDEAGTDDVAGLVDLETGGSATYLITSVLADPDSDQDITSSAIIVEPENVSDPDINNNEDEAAIRTGVFADGFESPPIP